MAQVHISYLLYFYRDCFSNIGSFFSVDVGFLCISTLNLLFFHRDCFAMVFACKYIKFVVFLQEMSYKLQSFTLQFITPANQGESIRDG
jgi:hypothetical protein